jgi:hypothetical protein
MDNDYNYRVKGYWEVRRNGLVSAGGVSAPQISFSAPVEFKGAVSRMRARGSPIGILPAVQLVTRAFQSDHGEMPARLEWHCDMAHSGGL